MILEDEDYLDAIDSMIRTECVNAEYAVAVTGDNFAEMFAGMDDDYMKARAADITDISNRLVRNLSGETEVDLGTLGPSIIVADDLTPSETVQMDKDKILAFVTVHGSTNSHTAILARMMNIPALVGVPMDLCQLQSGTLAVVDGFKGEVCFEPSEEICKEALRRMDEEKEKQELLLALKDKETVTLDGKEIKLYANIGSVSDVGYVLENDAEGIGLFRSEFLYLGKNDFPTEEEQFQAYKQVAQMMAGKKVIIRTLDIGADKQVDYFHLGEEENPALGYRAIRICLKQPEIFKTQLRALLRAAVYGNISIMYPMIISTEEVEQIYEIVEEVRKELEEAGIPYQIPEQGIMIETPAAVMISDELAQMVDFFSIGTNDLTQYTLAIDRQNAKLDDFYQPHHKAIMRMIQMVADNAHRHGKWVGICGELGADLELTEQFVRMGIDELSVAPSMILKIRKIIREMHVG
jgi:phosphotransferase system enzyme I (PtsI)